MPGCTMSRPAGTKDSFLNVSGDDPTEEELLDTAGL